MASRAIQPTSLNFAVNCLSGFTGRTPAPQRQVVPFGQLGHPKLYRVAIRRELAVSGTHWQDTNKVGGIDLTFDGAKVSPDRLLGIVVHLRNVIVRACSDGVLHV